MHSLCTLPHTLSFQPCMAARLALSLAAVCCATVTIFSSIIENESETEDIVDDAEEEGELLISKDENEQSDIISGMTNYE